MRYLIGIDLGTQGTKATLTDEYGGVIAEAFEESRLIFPEKGAVEQDPEEMLDSVMRTIRSIIERSGAAPQSIAGIGIDGQMAGIMGVDEDGMAVTPYDSWLDTRCGKYRRRFLEYGEERVISITGAPVTYAHGPKILWWKHERPDIYGKIHKFVQPAAYCVMRMCGLSGEEAYIDHTYLHFAGFADTENKKWSAELLDALDIDPVKMPRIVRPWDIIGEVTPLVAEVCGLSAGTPVVAGCGDTAASSFGAGIVEKGLLFDVAGTASVFAGSTNIYAPDTKHKTIIFAPSVVEGLYTPMAYINGGGMCLKWFRDDIMNGVYPYAQLDAMAENTPPGSEELLFLPHFSGRVCPNDTAVRGAYVNLGWKHKTGHLFRAIMEGIAYEYGIYADIIHELIPELKFERIISIGGGAASKAFGQIKADVLNTPVSTIKLADTAAVACCAIAGYGTGVYDSLTEPVRKVAVHESILMPTNGLAEFYKPRIEAYAQLFGALYGVFGQLQKLEPWIGGGQ